MDRGKKKMDTTKNFSECEGEFLLYFGHVHFLSTKVLETFKVVGCGILFLSCFVSMDREKNGKKKENLFFLG